MSAKKKVFTFAGTTPNAPGSAVVGSTSAGLRGFEEYDYFNVFADLVGATGGALDVYLERKVNDDALTSTDAKWTQFAHFTQLAAAAAAIRYAFSFGGNGTMTAPVASGVSDEGTPTFGLVLAANTIIPGHPGNCVRCVATAGAGTSAGAAISITIVAWRGNG